MLYVCFFYLHVSKQQGTKLFLNYTTVQLQKCAILLYFRTIVLTEYKECWPQREVRISRGLTRCEF